jgi:hypothetical protein
MANIFKPNQLAEAAALAFPQKAVFLLNTSNQLNRDYRAGNGATVNVVLPDYPEVVAGAAINAGTELNYQSGVKPLTVSQWHVSFGAEQMIRSLDIMDFAKQVARPYAAALASNIQKRAISESIAQADSSVVVGSAGVLDVSLLRYAPALVKKGRSFGSELFGVIDPLMMSQATNISNLFLPSGISEPMWKDAALGKFAAAEWFETPDCEDYVAGDCDQLASMSVTANLSEGATALGITFGTAPTSGTTLKKGHRFHVAGVYAVDIYGNSTGKLVDFVAKSYTVGGVTSDDVTFDGLITAITVNLEKAIYATSKPMINVSALPAANAGVDSVFVAGKTYLTGFVWAREAVYTAQTKLLSMAGTENFGESDDVPQGVIISYTAGPDILNGREVGRWDWVGGWVSARPNWTVAVFLPTT